MSETEYWGHLEYRVCHEFSGMPGKQLRHFWCDGILPCEYKLNEPSPRITGRAWICDDQEQENWEFTLFLFKPVASQSEIDWEALLPPRNTTRWMSLDIARKYIEFEPAAAVPDLTTADR